MWYSLMLNFIWSVPVHRIAQDSRGCGLRRSSGSNTSNRKGSKTKTRAGLHSMSSSVPPTTGRSTETCAGASWRTWSNPPRRCFSASSSGPGTERWAAAWWRWSWPWLHTAAPSCLSSSCSERPPRARLGRGTPAAGRRGMMQSPSRGTWVFLLDLWPAGPERSGAGRLRLPPS